MRSRAIGKQDGELRRSVKIPRVDALAGEPELQHIHLTRPVENFPGNIIFSKTRTPPNAAPTATASPMNTSVMKRIRPRITSQGGSVSLCVGSFQVTSV